VIQQLLKNGSALNAQGEYFGNAMQAVSAEGCEKLIQ